MSSKGQIAIPKQVREALNLTEGTKLTLEVRGQEIVLSKGAGWRNLRGAGRDVGKISWSSEKRSANLKLAFLIRGRSWSGSKKDNRQRTSSRTFSRRLSQAPCGS